MNQLTVALRPLTMAHVTRLLAFLAICASSACSSKGEAGNENTGVVRLAVHECGNGICDADENVIACPADCSIVVPSDQSWIPIGPAPIDSTLVYGPAGISRESASGRGTVIAPNPVDPREVYFGTANGGVWHTLDALAPNPEWRPLRSPTFGGSSDFLDSLAIGAIALEGCGTTPLDLNPGRCGRVWIGTGENVYRRHSYHGVGVYLGYVTGPAEFQAFSLVPIGSSDTLFRFGSVIDVIPGTSTAYAAVTLGMTATKNHSTVWAPEPSAGYGIHRCDGVAPNCTWTRVLASPAPHATGNLTGLPTDLERDPVNGGQYLAGIMGQGVYRSLAGDDTTWCPLNPGAPAFGSGACPAQPVGLPAAGTFDFVEIGVSAGSQTLVVSLSNCPQGNATGPSTGNGLTGAECPIVLYRSSDGGVSFNPVPAPTPATGYTTYSRYTHALQVLSNGAFCYGGLRLWCMNAGDAAPFEVGSNSLHPDHHDIVLLPGLGDGGQLLTYSSNDGGFYLSRNDSLSFVSANHNLVTSQFHGIGIDEVNETPADPQGRTTGVCGGLQDHGLVTFKGTRVWAHDTGFGDGGECRQLTPAIRWATDWSQVKRNNTGLSGISDAFPNRAFLPVLVEHAPTQSILFALESLRFVPATPANMTPAPVTISPQFDTGVYNFPAIERSNNVVTALGVAPSDVNRVYAGLYDGQVWASVAGANVTAGSCLTVPDCWQRVDTGLPDFPVSALAVSPANPDEVWVTFNSFGMQNIWRSTNAGQAWAPASSGIPVELPVNVIRFDPRDGTSATLLVGTNRGVYRTEDSGASFSLLGANLPNSPVFDIAVEPVFQRTYAATHGRGVFMLVDAPEVITFEGWTEDGIWDIPIYGNGFACGAAECACTVEVVQENGNVCAGPSATDARGANIRIRDGMLGSDMPFMFDNHPVILACFNGNCVGGATIASCNQPGNLISAIRLTCVDNNPIITPVAGECPQLAQPPASNLIVSPDSLPPLPPSGALTSLTIPRPLPGSGRPVFDRDAEIDVVPVLMASPDNGGDRPLCSARLALEPGDDVATIQQKTFDAIDADPECAAAGVDSRYVRVQSLEGEDIVKDIRVTVDAPSAFGAQIMVGFSAASGDAEGLCFRGSSLGVVATDQLGIAQLGFRVPAEGAAGGTLEVLESSPLGVCHQSIALEAGDSAEEIAQKVVAAFQAPGLPGPASCLAENNPRDITQDGASIVTIMSRDFEVCVRDANVGLTFAPHGVPLNRPPVAQCQDVLAMADEMCVAAIDPEQVDNGSFDPDGDAITCTLEPAGPFGLGSTTVTLICVDPQGAESSCTASVSVEDASSPVFSSVPPDITTTSCGALNLGLAAATDNCDPSVAIANDAPAKFPPGTTLVTWTATDDAGNVGTAVQRVTVVLTDNPACCPSGTNVIVGTSNNDLLNGTNGSDCILGRGAQDTINGFGGNDFISGGEGNDSINAGSGHDVVFGGAGQDPIVGGLGDDTLFGGDGDDNLQGGAGNDTLNGGQGQDVLQGQDDNDQLYGDVGDDNLQGGNGNDNLVGGVNNDTCNGGSGFNTTVQCEFGAPNSCVDTVQNGTETDIDCGGACSGCLAGDMCVGGSDCQSGVCSSGTCQGG